MNTGIHLPTLLMLSVALNVLIGALLWWIYHLRGQQPCFRLWALACAAFAGGSLLAAARELVDAPFVTGFVALAFLGLSPLLVLMGLQSFARLPLRRQRLFRRAALGAFAVYLLLIGATFLPAPTLSRGVTALFSALVFSIAVYRLSVIATQIQLPVRVLQVLFTVHGILMMSQALVITVDFLGSGVPGLDTLLRVILINHILLATGTALALPLMAFSVSENRLRALAERDSLTGLYNRRSVLREGARAFSKARAGNSALAVLMLDLDHFKRINDQWGHSIGDEVLRFVARTLEDELRDNDIVGRVGGEEFIAVLPLAPGEDFTHIANRLLGAISRHGSEIRGRHMALSASLGGILMSPKHRSLADMLQEADIALYTAKNKGRNRAEFPENTEQPAVV
ncbi:GGDEF domain-containing protein [Marinobacter confluentis]|uniref:diguanylate cyclase n=1 Tax=Marinobacter confluentis TaxID=1697557 RepID=A0A4Z1BX81_9GAMM|nr:GGDEF domain-containing protein [Marinobacter confluentis]TGN39220.1 GGDEF domain-containing protein [Marinobacter confluentis]